MWDHFLIQRAQFCLNKNPSNFAAPQGTALGYALEDVASAKAAYIQKIVGSA